MLAEAGCYASENGVHRWFTDAFFSMVCDRVSNGDTLSQVAKELCFDRADFNRVLTANPRLDRSYALARIKQAESWADQVVEVADDTSRDSFMRADGSQMPDNEWMARSKLRVDTRKWLMAKLHPAKYGDRIEVNGHTTVTHELGDSITGLLGLLRSERSTAEAAIPSATIPLEIESKPLPGTQ